MVLVILFSQRSKVHGDLLQSAELDTVATDSTEDCLSRMLLEEKLDIQGVLFVLLSVAEYVLYSHGLSRSLIGTITRTSMHWMKGLERSSELVSFRLAFEYLRLKPGWSTLLVYAVTKHGVSGKGMAFSEQQAGTVIELLRERIFRSMHR